MSRVERKAYYSKGHRIDFRDCVYYYYNFSYVVHSEKTLRSSSFFHFPDVHTHVSSLNLYAIRQRIVFLFLSRWQADA